MFRCAVVMFQEEFALRLSARPGDELYCRQVWRSWCRCSTSSSNITEFARMQYALPSALLSHPTTQTLREHAAAGARGPADEGGPQQLPAAAQGGVARGCASSRATRRRPSTSWSGTAWCAWRSTAKTDAAQRAHHGHRAGHAGEEQGHAGVAARGGALCGCVGCVGR